MAELTLKDLHKSYGPVDVIHGIDMSIQSGEFCVFVGPSGCGKSTLLRMIAGLEDITSGTIDMDGDTASQVSFLEVSVSASPLVVPWYENPRFSCLTNRYQTWMQSCASPCAAKSQTFMRGLATP